jgi:acylphosphatase
MRMAGENMAGADESGEPGGRRVVRVQLKGKVQGVGFRFWIEREAIVRGIEGWVRNRSDGTVEAVFAGDPDAVASMVETCSNGPPHARVTGVEVHTASDEDIDNGRTPGASFDVLSDV